MKSFLVMAALLLAACGAPDSAPLAETDSAQQYRGPLEPCPEWAGDLGYYLEVGCNCPDKPAFALFHRHECQPCKHDGHKQCKPCSGDKCK
jgi:hypothetical protein